MEKLIIETAGKLGVSPSILCLLVNWVIVGINIALVTSPQMFIILTSVQFVAIYYQIKVNKFPYD